MKAIEPQQMRTIYAIARSLGIDNDDLHALVYEQTEISSIKLLDSMQAYAVITELKHRQKTAGIIPLKAKKAKPTARPGGVTNEQQGKIWALIGQLEKFDKLPARGTHRNRLCGAIKKEFGMDAAPCNPFQWLTMKQGIQLIDALKRYAASAECKALREERAAIE